MSTEPIIGIDLGTTNSCVAVVENGTPRVIPNKGHLTTPSMVSFTAGGKRLVGHIAKRQAITNAEHTVYALKRLIGRQWDSAQARAAVEMASYKVHPGSHDDLRVEIRGNQYSLAEISAMILEDLKAAADEYLGRSVTRAVVTVPAYFNDNQRQATRDAGEIAGLDIVRVINEPTAAALAFGHGKSAQKTIAVYDLGGGTFDISIVKVDGKGTYEVLATGGDTTLGGEDFDRRVMDWLIDGFLQEHGVDLRTERTALQRLKDAAETAKCALSGVDRHDISLPFIATGADGAGMHLDRTLDKKTFETLNRDLVNRTIDVCKEVIAAAKLDVRKLDEMVLVGGSSRMPMVQAEVTALFGRAPSKGVHPDEAVAVGAALHAASIAEEVPPVQLKDVTAHALGLLITGRIFEELIPANAPIPARCSKMFTTSRDNQTRMKIAVVQRTSEERKNEPLGDFSMALPALPQGQVTIDVGFAIDADGIVKVSARNLASGEEQTLDVSAKSSLTRDEIVEMAATAREHRAGLVQEDTQKSIAQDVERLIAAVEQLLPEVARRSADSDDAADAMGAALGALGGARAALEKGDQLELGRKAGVLAQCSADLRKVLAG